jgi:hypothetical protein
LASGFTTIGEIDEIIDRGEEAFQLYELERPPVVSKGKPRRFLDVGVVRITLNIFSEKFLREERRRRIDNPGELDDDVRKVSINYEKYRRLIH